MANPLTGDFEAVVQLAVSQLNGLLGTLHQNGLTATTALKLLHNARTRIGDGPRTPDLGAFGDWVNEFQSARPPGPKPPLSDLLVATSPPAVAKRLAVSFADLLVLEQAPVRGAAVVQ